MTAPSSEPHLRGGPRCSNSLGRWPAIAIARRDTTEDRGHLVLPTFGHTTAHHIRPGGGDNAAINGDIRHHRTRASWSNGLSTRLKQWRAVATCYDKLALTYPAGFLLAGIVE
ncbi:hypothetical protein EEB14_52845 [Rhodococcus sp. WS4]|nr:hypothetical protein EEB14_52845 [Rhodococcus sp. WS4]